MDRFAAEKPLLVAAAGAKLQARFHKHTRTTASIPSGRKMAKYEGIAAMYMSMPMAAQALPILGSCSVEDKKISLRFPLSNVSFDLPEAPREGGRDVEFKMAGPKGEMNLKIAYKSDLQGFVGQGQQDGYNVLTFIFYRPGSGLANLRSL